MAAGPSPTIKLLTCAACSPASAAGLLALIVAYLLGEPRVDAAIDYEDAHTTGPAMEIVSRSLQSTAGLATGVLIYGVSLRGIAALAYSFALGRVGRFQPARDGCSALGRGTARGLRHAVS